MDQAEFEGLSFALAAVTTFSFGAALFFYERFAAPSRWYFATTTAVAGWLGCIAATSLPLDPASVGALLRAAYAFDAVTGPAVLGLILFLAGVSRPRLLIAAWVVGAAFALLSLSGQILVPGILALLATRGPAGPALVAAAYFLFLLGCIGVALVELTRAFRAAADADTRRRHGLVLLSVAIGALAFFDLLLPWVGLTGVTVSPFAITASTLVMGVAASRYRVLASVPTFAAREVIRTITDAVLVLDRAGAVRNANPAAAALFGAPEAELKGKPVTALLEVDAEPGESVWRDRETVARGPSGERIHVSVSTAPLRKGPLQVGSVIVARDIRERLRAHETLAEVERRFRALFQFGPAIAYEIAADGAMVSVNPAGERLLGEAADTIRGRNFIELIEPDDRPEALEIFEQVLSGVPGVYELGLRRPDGKRRRLRGVSVPVRAGEEVVSVLGIGLDVTEETRAKQGLEVQRRYYAELFEASPEAVALVAADGTVRRVNGEFARLFGYAREEVVGRRLDDLILPADREDEAQELTRQALSGVVARAETVRRRKEGGVVEVSLLARELRIPGEPPQMYVVYRDITDRRLAERRLREREEELRHAQKLEAVGKLAGGIAHDFNNLLTVITGNTRFLLDRLAPGEPWRPDLEEIERAGVRAAALTQQLLAFSRRQVLRPQVLDVHTVILDIERMLSRLIGEHIRLVTQLRAADARVRVDRGQLEQVVMNLVVNARDAMPEGGTITLLTDTITLADGAPDLRRWEIAAGTYVRLRVSDTGRGMAPETLDRAFEPFFTTKDRGKGTGLGLSTVFGIVKQSGGHVTAVSAPGAGSTFSVLLPLTAAHPEDGGAEPGPLEAGPATAQVRRVLVVEDEAAVRKLAARVLERAGHAVLQAENGAEALKLIARCPDDVDVVVTDLVMPEMGGRELRAALRRSHPRLPVIFMSGYDDEQSLAGTYGDDAFLPKPFTPAALVDAVSRTLVAAGSG